jgi:hypothetical protein
VVLERGDGGVCVEGGELGDLRVGDGEVALGELVGDVPAQRAELPAALHHGVEDAQALEFLGAAEPGAVLE